MASAARPALLDSGLKPVDRSLETHWVKPGAATAVSLRPEDRLTIVNRDGAQVAELTVLDLEGGEDAAAIGAKVDADASVLRGLDGNGDARGFSGQLHARGLVPGDARALRLFDDDTPRGTVETFTAEREATAIVAAPGGRVVDGAWPASPLMVEVHRAVPRELEEVELPPPLAEPRLDFRIDRATAAGYEVGEGEYIQIIDVRGKQCSDFLAFNRPKLERGLERGLDATTTRTLMASAYPQPGLYRKSFDVDMDPLVEVVQDTVGRHDSFALACTAKYYEDQGYPGHINCSENFNGQVTPYGVAPRKGWEALNFFYNTGFDQANAFIIDEPWSRPGDYVLLRAAADLLCASSACPDDIDPANGWEITDIHVRVYSPENRFSQAIAHRVTPEADPVMTKETAFHPRISALTRDLVEYRGYWLPDCFEGEGSIAEYWACRERAAIMDLSPLRKWEVLGPDAEMLMQLAITRDARKLSVGQVTYTAVCNETGGMLDDATVYRLADDNFRFVTGDEYTGVHLAKLADDTSLRVWVKPSTDQLHNLAVQGPESREILKQLVWTAPTQPRFEELRWFRFLVGRIGDYDGIPIVVSRTGYTGELGYEVWCHPDDGPAVWDAIWGAGEGHGLTPLGLSALDMLRIESGLIFAGYEFDDQIDPFEAGIGFAVALDSEDDFIGKEALLERRAHPQRKLVGLELAGQETAGHGDCVHVPGSRSDIGVITSGTRSPVLRKNIALCRMAVQYAEPGTEVEVGKLDGHQKRIPATVVRFPFYDPEKTRPRS
jgi:glycine cleavage system T protein (aminomethyltransferase)